KRLREATIVPGLDQLRELLGEVIEFLEVFSVSQPDQDPDAQTGPPTSLPPATPGRKKRRRQRTLQVERAITAKEAEAVKVVGECGGNFAAAARQLGKHRKTVQELYQSGMAKAGSRGSYKDDTGKATSALRRHAVRTGLPTDRRGQAVVHNKRSPEEQE